MERIVYSMTYPNMKQVADHLESVRKGQGFTNKQLAERAGMTAYSIKAKLAGERPITTGDLFTIATALGTTPGQIYSELS